MLRVMNWGRFLLRRVKQFIREADYPASSDSNVLRILVMASSTCEHYLDCRGQSAVDARGIAASSGIGDSTQVLERTVSLISPNISEVSLAACSPPKC